MPDFSRTSSANLAECHPELQHLFTIIVKYWDCTILDGARSVEEQKANVASGASQTLASKHLRQADGFSHAVDVLSYPFDWDQLTLALNKIASADARTKAALQQLIKQYAFKGYILGMAKALGIDVRLGIDWDGDLDFWDSSFIDLPHVELPR
jgi:peptidoglycan L-alanyl-D-glutamate endopeptidase CwlK